MCLQEEVFAAFHSDTSIHHSTVWWIAFVPAFHVGVIFSGWIKACMVSLSNDDDVNLGQTILAVDFVACVSYLLQFFVQYNFVLSLGNP